MHGPVSLEDALQKLSRYFNTSSLHQHAHEEQYGEQLRAALENNLVEDTRPALLAGYLIGRQLAQRVNEGRFGNGLQGGFLLDVSSTCAKYVYAERSGHFELPTLRLLLESRRLMYQPHLLESLPERDRGRIANTYGAELLIQNGARSLEVFTRMHAPQAFNYLANLLHP